MEWFSYRGRSNSCEAVHILFRNSFWSAAEPKELNKTTEGSKILSSEGRLLRIEGIFFAHHFIAEGQKSHSRQIGVVHER